MATEETKSDGVTRMRELYEMEARKAPSPSPDSPSVQRPRALEAADRFAKAFIAKPGLMDTVRAAYVPPAPDAALPVIPFGMPGDAAGAGAGLPPSTAPDGPDGDFADFGPAEALGLYHAISGDQHVISQLDPKTAARITELTKILEAPEPDKAETQH